MVLFLLGNPKETTNAVYKLHSKTSYINNGNIKKNHLSQQGSTK